MDNCEKCKHLESCDELNMPKEVIARIIDLINTNSDDTVIENIIQNEFKKPIESYGYSIKMLKKYLLNLEDDCINTRK